VTNEQIQETVKKFDLWIDKLPEPRLSQIRKLIEELGQRFFTAPASGSIHKHDAEPGGLLTHSLSVFKNLMLLNNALGKDLPLESLIICGLFHDLGKIGTLEGLDMYVPVTENWRVQKGYRYEHNKEIKDGLTHAQRSVRLLSHYGVKLTDDEYFAILSHDGLYVDENASFKRQHNSKLAMLMHWADYYTAFFDTERT
jgi:23S rRNA maturation-related 3'-5' exoribonuclease YhaM